MDPRASRARPIQVGVPPAILPLGRGATVAPADIVAHDKDDVGLAASRLSLSPAGREQADGHREADSSETVIPTHRILLSRAEWTISSEASPIDLAPFRDDLSPLLIAICAVAHQIERPTKA